MKTIEGFNSSERTSNLIMKGCIPFAALLLAASPVALRAANAGAGQIVYAKACKTCHGAQGEGNAAVGKALGVTMPDLRSKLVQTKSDTELESVITGGKGKMKAVKSVSGADAADIVAFLRGLANK
jgi:mono/diheme cytochrome c family protein